MSTSSISTLDVQVNRNQPKQFQQFCRQHERGLMVLGMLLVVCLHTTIVIAAKVGPLSSRWLGISASVSYIGAALLTTLMAAKRTPRILRRRMMMAWPSAILVAGFLLYALW